MLDIAFGFLASKHVERGTLRLASFFVFTLLAWINANLFYPAVSTQLTIQISNL